MIDIDTFTRLLEEQTAQLPQEIYAGLNLGIGVVEHAKRNPTLPHLFILGEYHRHGVMGRGIVLYYGSFVQVYGALPEEDLRREIDRVLKHELTHHLESQAGERDLEIEDAQHLDQLRRDS